MLKTYLTYLSINHLKFFIFYSYNKNYNTTILSGMTFDFKIISIIYL